MKTISMLLCIVLACMACSFALNEASSMPAEVFEQAIQAADMISHRDYDSAIENYSKAVYYDPNNAEALFDLGNAYRRKEDSVNAITTFNRVIELFPDTDTARKAKQFLVDYDDNPSE